MKYSVIIPTLNEEKLLPEILKQLNNSAIRDNYQIEIIISDGGSSDATVEIAVQQADSVIVHNLDSPQTIAAGRNRGAEAASGEVFIFFNGDIRIENPQKFFKIIEKEFLPGGYDAMTCLVYIFPEEETFTDRFFQFIYNTYFHLLNILGVGMGRGECQVIRRDVFLKNNGYNEKMAAGEDFDLFKRIKRNGRILFSRRLKVYESPRRYRKIGYLAVTWAWIENALSVIFKNKSIADEWEQVR